MIRKSIKEKIKVYFLTFPSSKLRVRELERKLKLPLPSVIRYCDELSKEGILRIEEIGNIKLFAADKTSKMFILEKKINNLRQIIESGILEHLKFELSNPTVILFGSFAKGEDTEESDIDIYIETESKKIINTEKYEIFLRHKIQIFRSSSLSDLNNLHLANNILNGTILAGYIEVFK